ncbi:MAG: hypothetical protein JJU46_06260 [Balneolaceae bacterium]|nr:hypothetical protein [Balneolaceae bacterium]MCH8547688.1 DUF6364 family protein [Balneolaceae bacterium]
MKKKLTLTVQEDVIKYAKRQAKRRGISVSQMFEEAIGKEEINEIETESQRAAKRLLKNLEDAESIETRDDKKLIRDHVERKFT